MVILLILTLISQKLQGPIRQALSPLASASVQEAGNDLVAQWFPTYH